MAESNEKRIVIKVYREKVAKVRGLTMMSPGLYTGPDRSDPDRFSPNRAEGRRHRFAWTPFGGGAQKCIALHFSMIQVKLFTAALLRHARNKLPHRPEIIGSACPYGNPTAVCR